MTGSPGRDDRAGRTAGLEREVAALRAENRRLRHLLKVTDGVEPPPTQALLVPPDPGVVTNESPNPVKLALFANRFAARPDVYAYYWENQRKGTRGWSPKARDQYGQRPLWDRRPEPLTLEVMARHLSSVDPLFLGLYPLLRDATC